MKRTEHKINDAAIAHKFADINGIKYHYAEAGRGPLVLMIHGAFELWYSWRLQIAALASAGYHPIAMDLRGHGESEVTPAIKDYSLFQHADDLKKLIEYLGENEVVIRGQQCFNQIFRR